jgi:CDGSH-type Zn-finger protein
MGNVNDQKRAIMKIKIIKDGPYLVSGGIPLYLLSIIIDGMGQCHGWKEGENLSTSDSYTLCRCGRSKHKPFCDGTHLDIGFDGTEVASNDPYLHRAERIDGPELTLTDHLALCSDAGFCERAGGIWRLVERSSDPESRQTAIEEAADCPSGRLVIWDKHGNELEPKFIRSVGITTGPPDGRTGPLWIRGGIPIEGSNGTIYEIRNRVTLCRCGKSVNNPFCDGGHRHIQAGEH